MAELILWTIEANGERVDGGANLRDLRAAYMNRIAEHRTPDCSGGASIVAYVRGVRVTGFDADGMPVVARATFLVPGRKPPTRGFWGVMRDHDTCTHHTVDEENVALDVVEDLGVVESTRGGSPSYDPALVRNRAFRLADGRVWILS